MNFYKNIVRPISQTLFACICLVLPLHVSALNLKAEQWQLVSFPRLPANASIDNTFGDAKSKITAIWTFDNNTKTWQSWPKYEGLETSNLTHLNVGQGYWMQATQDINLEITNASETVGEMVLYPGWNLIGLSSDNLIPHEQALAGVPFLEIWKYDSNRNKFLSVQKSRGSQIILKEEFTDIEVNTGLWVYMAEQSALLPSMGTLLPPDIDLEPLLSLSEYGVEALWDNLTPGDIDWNGDGYFDFPNTQDTVAFGDFLNRQRIAITNDGNGVLNWQATIEPAVDWLLFESLDEGGQAVLTDFAIGNVSNSNGELIMVANRTGMQSSNNYKTQIVLRANGSVQEKRIDVTLDVADIIGDYEMTVNIASINDKTADVHNPVYFLSFAPDGEFSVKAFLDEERSLLIPEITYLSGAKLSDPESHFQVLGQLHLPAEHEHNPYNQEIRREFTITGKRGSETDGLSPLDLKGSYSENIYGVFDQPIQIQGEFIARRLSAEPKKKDSIISEFKEGNILSGSPESPSVNLFDLNITERFSIIDVMTKLKVNHPVPESLSLALIGPSWFNEETQEEVRTIASLHEYQSSDLSNVSYDDFDESIDSLDIFNGQLSLGQWTLSITNTSSSVGRLENWSLDVSGASVHKVTGTLPDAGINIQLNGCGIVLNTETDENGYFEFDGLIPCDYELAVLQLGYEVTTATIRIKKCTTDQGGTQCDTEEDYTEALSASQIEELSPQLIASSGEMKVLLSPSTAQLPITLQAVDVTDYNQLDKTLQSRTWQLYKRINNTTAISEDGYLIDIEPKPGEVEFGKNYISYSENFTQWSPVGVRLSKANILDPRSGNAAVNAVHNGNGKLGWIFRSETQGDGTFPVKSGDVVTFSVFAKAGSTNQLRFRFGDGSSFISSKLLNLVTGDVISETNLPSKVTPLANDWYRVEVSLKASKNYTDMHCDLSMAKNGIYEITTQENLYVFGPQCEVNRASGLVNFQNAENHNAKNYHPDPYNENGWNWGNASNGTLAKVETLNPSNVPNVNLAEQTGSGYFIPVNSYNKGLEVKAGERTYSSFIVRVPDDSEAFGLSLQLGMDGDLSRFKIHSNTKQILWKAYDIDNYEILSLPDDFYLIQVERTHSRDLSNVFARLVFGSEVNGSVAPVGSKAEIQGFYVGKSPFTNPYVMHKNYKLESDLDNWHKARYTASIANGAVKLVSTGGDPQFLRFLKNTNDEFDGSKYSHVKIRYRVNQGVDYNSLFFGNESADSFSGKRHIVFGSFAEQSSEVTLEGPDADGYYVATLDLSNNSRWTKQGLVTRLRFDFASNAIGTDTDVDYIKIYNPDAYEAYAADYWPASYTAPKPLSEVTASAYIPTGAAHAERSINGQQNVLITEQTTGLRGSFSHQFSNIRSNAGVYFVKLNSDVLNASRNAETLPYTTQDILAIKNPEAIHVGMFSLFGAAGTPSLKAMDSATFDIDRFPLMSTSGSQGVEDSDGFKADDLEDDAYETNAPNDVGPSAGGGYYAVPTGMDAPAGNLNKHYKMYISAGQLYQGGSMYSGGVRLDTGIQSQEESK
ncbi:hypothetical protein NBRC116188_21670 [Oceaniserpentilla sp. 4NH20-0058]|uniref:phage head spike fiber domain-containing protein n=1 Tax=Oceaniserpentilla sp. 4NH20-0058 TaxID=3127660 RepID=UPI00310C1FAB